MKKHLHFLILFFAFMGSFTSYAQQELKDSISVAEMDFKYLDSKFKLNYKDDNEDFEAKVKLRMCKDSLIWVSITGSIGIEGLRLFITRDSIYAIDRLEKKDYILDYKTLSERLQFELNFDILQAIIIGGMPYKEFDKNKVKDVSQADKDYWLIKQKIQHISIDNYINPENKRLELLQLTDAKTNNWLKMSYQNFTTLENSDLLFPNSSYINLKYLDKEKKIRQTNIEINHFKVLVTNEPLNFPFTIQGHIDSGSDK
ncbi:MAG: DUF4292 domain-containing protein [Cytophagales bacterium]|nr:MAG: DUF4292 domain-containing protein [Cytophagales bacterium]